MRANQLRGFQLWLCFEHKYEKMINKEIDLLLQRTNGKLKEYSGCLTDAKKISGIKDPLKEGTK